MNAKRSLVVVMVVAMALVAGLVFALGGTAQANPMLFASDDYATNTTGSGDYYDDTIIVGQDRTRLGFTGAWGEFYNSWWVANVADLTYTGWSSSGPGSLYSGGAGDPDAGGAYRNFASGAGSAQEKINDTFYFSYLVNRTLADAEWTMLTVSDASGNYRMDTGIHGTGTGSGKFFVEFLVGGSSVALVEGGSYTGGSTALIIGKLVRNNDSGGLEQLSIWANPTIWTSESDANGTQVSTSYDAFGSSTTLTNFMFFLYASYSAQQIDEVRFGSTWYSVTGQEEPNPVPEPAGIGLVGMALLALRRRRA